METKRALLRFDGGSRGNPGKAGCGFVIKIEQTLPMITGSLYLGENITNNYAEYSGLVEGLKVAVDNNITDIEIEGDSMLVIQQLLGNWKVSSQNIKPLYENAVSLLKHFNTYSLKHILRANNKVADALANKAMDFGT